MGDLGEYLAKRGITEEQMDDARKLTANLVNRRPVKAELLIYDATMARRDAGIEEDGETPVMEAYSRTIGILNEELNAIRSVAREGACETDADPRHVTDGLWPYVKHGLEWLGFRVRNIVDSQYARVGARISW